MKVGHKARHGRRRRPVGHKPHRRRGAIRDPISRAMKRATLLLRLEDEARAERDEWLSWGRAA